MMVSMYVCMYVYVIFILNIFLVWGGERTHTVKPGF